MLKGVSVMVLLLDGLSENAARMWSENVDSISTRNYLFKSTAILKLEKMSAFQKGEVISAQHILINHLMKDPRVFVQFEYISFRKFYKVGNLTWVVSTGSIYIAGKDS